MTDEESTPKPGAAEFPTEEDLPDEPLTADDIDPFTVDSEGFEDINEFATAEWKESTTANERIRAVIKRTTMPKSAADIADAAAVSETKARDTLNDLATEGTVRTEETASRKLYERDPDWHLLRQVHRLARSETLVDQIQRVKKELATYAETYGADSPEEVLVSDRELSEDELTDISHWRTAKREFSYLRTAYRLQEAKAEMSGHRQQTRSMSQRAPSYQDVDRTQIE
jgi:hypothetical protein